jgi:hypothetical protein
MWAFLCALTYVSEKDGLAAKAGMHEVDSSTLRNRKPVHVFVDKWAELWKDLGDPR